MQTTQCPRIVIVNFGSQYTLVIARILREIGVRSIVLQPQKVADWINKNKPLGIILSGGDGSVSTNPLSFKSQFLI